MSDETLASIALAAETALGERDVRIWRAALRDILRLARPVEDSPKMEIPEAEDATESPTGIFFKVTMNKGPEKGESTHWIALKPEGEPELGCHMDEIPTLEASLAQMESYGATCVSFENEVFTIVYTHDPSKVEA